MRELADIRSFEHDRRADLLIARLREGNRDERMLSIGALARLGSAAAVAPLADLLINDPSQPLRGEAAVALGEIGGEDALRALRAGSELQSSVKDLMWIAEGLGRTRDPRAIEPLARLLEHRKWSVRLYAARALGRLRDASGARGLLERAGHDRHPLVARAARDELSVARDSPRATAGSDPGVDQ